ncbi:MAG: hypothetical protein M1816_006296 [Peltula sp. TS41687]|nr:MAG: hypothetical protein M1816_006296 [Peltula sp. TS41687]
MRLPKYKRARARPQAIDTTGTAPEVQGAQPSTQLSTNAGADAGSGAPASGPGPALSTLTPTSRPRYTGAGLVDRTLMLELVATPDSWPSTAASPEDLGIQIIRIPIWLNGAGEDVPTLSELPRRIHENYDPISPALQRRDKKTGLLVEKTCKATITSEADMRSAWTGFSQVPATDTLELFFALAPRSTTQVLHDIDPDHQSVSGPRVKRLTRLAIEETQ